MLHLKALGDVVTSPCDEKGKVTSSTVRRSSHGPPDRLHTLPRQVQRGALPLPSPWTHRCLRLADPHRIHPPKAFLMRILPASPLCWSGSRHLEHRTHLLHHIVKTLEGVERDNSSPSFLARSVSRFSLCGLLL